MDWFTQRTSLGCVGALVMTFLTAGLTSASPASSDFLHIDGPGNTIELERTRGNSLFLIVIGGNNGGLGREWPSNPLLHPAIKPGRIVQDGFGNSLALEVLGTNTIFAIVQQGVGNIVDGFSSGNSNVFSIVQSGQNNLVAFTQNGQGNSLSISQGSW